MDVKKFAKQRSFTLYQVDEQALSELAKYYRMNLSAAVRLAIQREYSRLTQRNTTVAGEAKYGREHQ